MSNPYAPPEDRPRTPTGPAPEPDRPHGAEPSSAEPGAPGPRPAADPSERRPTTDARTGTARAGTTGTSPTGTGPTSGADPQSAARAVRLARLAGLLVLASVLVLSFPVPWQAAAPVFAVGGVVVAIRGFTAAMAGRVRGGVQGVLGLLLVVSAMLGLVGGSMLALWVPQRDHQTCLANAITVTAKSRCDRQFDQDVEDWRGSLERRARS